jgi:hypothetical protein
VRALALSQQGQQLGGLHVGVQDHRGSEPACRVAPLKVLFTAEKTKDTVHSQGAGEPGGVASL